MSNFNITEAICLLEQAGHELGKHPDEDSQNLSGRIIKLVHELDMEHFGSALASERTADQAERTRIAAQLMAAIVMRLEPQDLKAMMMVSKAVANAQLAQAAIDMTDALLHQLNHA